MSGHVFSIGQSLFTGRLRIVFVFAILTVAPLISEYQLGNTPVTLVVLQKCLGTVLLNYHKLAQYHYHYFLGSLHLILMFALFHANLLHIHVSIYPKNDY